MVNDEMYSGISIQLDSDKPENNHLKSFRAFFHHRTRQLP